MKKNEIKILIGLGAAILIAFLVLKNPFKKKEPAVQVIIRHKTEIVETFDPYVTATYHIQGSYGTLDVQVEDGKWRVVNEECPNHICASLSWVKVGENIPIVCMPNEVIIMELPNDNK